MAKLTQENPHKAKRLPPAPPSTVWQIMRSSVNDNSPGYMYWFVRIGIASTLCGILIFFLKMMLSL